MDASIRSSNAKRVIDGSWSTSTSLLISRANGAESQTMASQVSSRSDTSMLDLRGIQLNMVLRVRSGAGNSASSYAESAVACEYACSRLFSRSAKRPSASGPPCKYNADAKNPIVFAKSGFLPSLWN